MKLTVAQLNTSKDSCNPQINICIFIGINIALGLVGAGSLATKSRPST